MKIYKLDQSGFLKKILSGITLMLLTCGIVTSTHAAGSGTDIFSFIGTTQTVNTTFFSPSSGQNVVVNGTFRVNTSTYDGLGGFDLLSATNDSDFILGPDVKNIEQTILGSGNDALNFSDHTMGAAFLGGAGNDIIITGSGSDIIFGAGENDFIDSGAGDDQAYGNAGNDTIFSGAGNDILGIGLGEDQATGGLGNDIFSLAVVDSLIDTITDFTLGDILDLDAMLQGFDPGIDSLADFIQFSQQNNDLLLSVSASGLPSEFKNVALLENVQLDNIILLDKNNISQPLYTSTSQFIAAPDPLFSGQFLFGLRESSTASVSEPSMLVLLGIGLIGLMRYRRYK